MPSFAYFKVHDMLEGWGFHFCPQSTNVKNGSNGGDMSRTEQKITPTAQQGKTGRLSCKKKKKSEREKEEKKKTVVCTSPETFFAHN